MKIKNYGSDEIKNDISCEQVVDLLPLFIDNVCSEDSRALIEEHLNKCGSYKNIFEQMNAKIEVDEGNLAENTMKKIPKLQ